MLQNQCLKMIEEDPTEFESNLANNRSTMIYLDILGPLNKGYQFLFISKQNTQRTPLCKLNCFSNFLFHIFCSYTFTLPTDYYNLLETTDFDISELTIESICLD